MNFILKIVEGPNKGAEIALVEGVAVTLGKDDACDVVLADPTLGEAPLKVEASAEGVSVDGAALAPFAVMTSGATSFAVGPADAPWGALVWPKADEGEGGAAGGDAGAAKGEEGPAKREEGSGEDASSRAPGPDAGEGPGPSGEAPAKKRRLGCCCGCFLLLLVLLLLLAGLGWLFRDRIGESDRFEQFAKIGKGWYARFSSESREAKVSGEKPVGLSDIAAKYGLALVESNGVAAVVGNLATRAERLRATAEAYAAQPGASLDLSDDESLRTAADDALFTLTEGAVKATVATNRYLHLAGTSPSPRALRRTLEQLAADLPKLRGVDASGVRLASPTFPNPSVAGPDADARAGGAPARLAAKRAAAARLPVCGILTTPYPCLVLRDGRRLMEGASIGDGVVLEIGADSVTVTNAAGRFTWKP